MELYLLKSTTCLAILYAFYKLILEGQHMHQIKRFYWIFGLIAAFGIPLITFTTVVEVPMTTAEAATELALINPTEVSNVTSWDYWPTLLWSIYSAGVVIFGWRMIRNLATMILRIRKNPRFENRGMLLVLLTGSVIPHSFFSYIFLNKRKFEAEEIPGEVLTHEAAHARQLHTIDILFIELLQVLFWFNPMLFLIKRSMRLNHEFLADQAVLDQGTETTDYQKILLAYSSHATVPALAHSINYSSIKKRFTVMKTQTSTTNRWLRILVLLPLLSLLIYSFSSREELLQPVMEDDATTHLTARSMEIKVLGNDSYEVEGIKATRTSLASVAAQFHQDITYADRNRVMNIHIIEPKNVPNEEVQFIFDALWDYGFHRLVSGNQEVVRSKGNRPFASETTRPQKSDAQLYLEGANRNNKKAFVVEIYNSTIRLNSKTVKLKDFAMALDAYTKNWEETDYTSAYPSIRIKNTPQEFLDKVEAEFQKTHYARANGGAKLIPPPPPPPPAPVKANSPAQKVVKGSKVAATVPPPPPPPPPVKSKNYKATTVVKGEPAAADTPPPPPPPPAPEEPLDHLISMAKKGATFYYEDTKISSDKAIELLKKNGDLNIQTTGYNSKNPKVRISKEGITVKN